jgi:K+-sensing histidine kinase KdpD
MLSLNLRSEHYMFLLNQSRQVRRLLARARPLFKKAAIRLCEAQCRRGVPDAYDEARELMGTCNFLSPAQAVVLLCAEVRGCILTGPSDVSDCQASLSQRSEAMEANTMHGITSQAGSLRKAVLDCVIHELRTPLTSIKTSVTALLTIPRLAFDERIELLTIIDEETDRLNLLVGEAVGKTRLDTGERLTLEPCAIEEIIDAARNDCRGVLGAHSLQVHVPLGLPAVRADLRLVKKALAQLLENASKYSPPEEPITVCVEMTGDFVMTSVIDRGSGVDTHEQHLIFDELYRGKNQCHLVPGTGMGLPIAKAIVEAHGGSLSVMSERGCGSVFSFSLPIDPQLIPGPGRFPV